jgi:hypothetical protein
VKQQNRLSIASLFVRRQAGQYCSVSGSYPA